MIKFLKASRNKIILAAAIYAWAFTTIAELPYTIIDRIYHVRPLNPVFTEIYISLFILLSLFVIVNSWFIADILQSMAISLGYSKTSSYQFNIDGAGNVINIPTSDKTDKISSTFPSTLAKEYDVNNVLSPLDSSKFRMLDHISKLRNNSVINLIVGICIAVVGVFVMATALFEGADFVDPATHSLDVKTYTFTVLIPRLSITLFVQVFAYFFLIMYRSNQNDIKFFQNEVTFIDSFAASIIIAQEKGISSNTKLIIGALAKNERNRVIKKERYHLA